MWPFVKSAPYLTAHPCLTSQKPLSICCLSTPCGSLTENKDYSNDHLCLCFSWLGSCGWWRDNFLESVWRKKPAHLTGQILRYRTWETLGGHSLLACISQSPSAMRIGTRSSSEVNSSPRIPALLTSCAIEIPFPVCYNVKWKCADYTYMATPTVVGPSPLSKLHSRTFTELHLVQVSVSQHPSEWHGAKGNLKSILNFFKILATVCTCWY